MPFNPEVLLVFNFKLRKLAEYRVTPAGGDFKPPGKMTIGVNPAFDGIRPIRPLPISEFSFDGRSVDGQVE